MAGLETSGVVGILHGANPTFSMGDLQSVGDVGPDLVRAFPFAPAAVLHPIAAVRLPRQVPAGLDINHPRVADHFRMNIPVGHHEIADQIQTGQVTGLTPNR